MLSRLLPFGALLALGACAYPPPMAAAQTPAPASESTVQAGLLNAEWNLDQAIALGMLPANDHADACMHAALIKIGIEPAQAGKPGAKPPASFTPRVTDLISGGALLYIQGEQARRAARHTTYVLPSCMQIIGQFVLDAATVENNGQRPGNVLSAR